MKPIVSVGNQSFVSIRENNYFYIDKTDFIRTWWNGGDIVTLITRPRRFGKTINMNMIESFFSNQYAGREDLFEGLKVWKDEQFRAQQGTYPVIFLSFAGIKETTFKMTRYKICQMLTEQYEKYQFLLSEDLLSETEKDAFQRIDVNMNDADASMALYHLSNYLYRFYGKKVIILLDEYDTPMQEAYVDGYWKELVAFTRSLFNCTFKTNPYMERGIMTGITRVSKESIFSDLNNLQVITTTSGKYETSFGFTEEEVRDALGRFGYSDQMDRVKFWYDGFCFGSRKDIYNPWSITKFLDSGKFDNYWANTSSNSLVGKLIREGSPDTKEYMEDLLDGKTIETPLDEEIVFNQLDQFPSAIWSLLLASGYLKVIEAPEEGAGEIYRLALTNYEVQKMFRRMIGEWFGSVSSKYNGFIQALLEDDVDYMNEYMNQIALKTFSSFDVGNKSSNDAEPERFYHGFILGLMVDLSDQYRITSNRESGLGRYDVVMEPLKENGNAYVLEFKVHRPRKEKDLEETVQNALKQIEDKQYDTELLARGIPQNRIRHYGFAFEGKTVLIG